MITSPSLRAHRLDVQRIVVHAHGLAHAADLQLRIERERRIRVEHDVFTLVAVEASGLHFQFIVANRQDRKGKITVSVGARMVRETCIDFGEVNTGSGDETSGRICHGAGDASGYGGAEAEGEQEGKRENR